jgi:hypothetical protein
MRNKEIPYRVKKYKVLKPLRSLISKSFYKKDKIMDLHLIKLKKTYTKFKIIKNKKELTSKEINPEMVRIQKINIINKCNILILHIWTQEQVHYLIIL